MANCFLSKYFGPILLTCSFAIAPLATLAQETPAATNGFAGPYVGISAGLSNDNLFTYRTGGGTITNVTGGVFAGYNHQLLPWLTAGFELQIDLTRDILSPTTTFDFAALGRVGIATSPNFAIYEMAGLGYVQNRAVYAFGVGFEQKLSRNISFRSNMLTYGHLQPYNSNPMVGGFSILKIDAGVVWKINDEFAPEIDFSYLTSATPATDFTGPYLGAYAGLTINPDYNFFTLDYLIQLHLSRISHGAIMGWNYSLSDKFRAGVEIQGGINYNTSSGWGMDAQALARVGFVPFEGLMVYASSGLGVLENRGTYIVGGGVEYALWGNNTLRLDAQFQGEMQPAPPENLAGFTATKVTIGTLWHFN